MRKRHSLLPKVNRTTGAAGLSVRAQARELKHNHPDTVVVIEGLENESKQGMADEMPSCAKDGVSFIFWNANPRFTNSVNGATS
jgi:hypothetical protein